MEHRRMNSGQGSVRASPPPIVSLSGPKRRLLSALQRGQGAALLSPRRSPSVPPTLLSDAQMSIWAAEKLYAEDPINTIGIRYDIDGAVDPDRLRGALSHLVARHDVLRAGFVVSGAAPHHEVAAAVPTPFDVVVLSDLSEREYADRLDGIMVEVMASRFVLSEPPLLRIVLVRRHETHSVLLLAAHHLIADVRSLAILVGQLNEMYAGSAVGDGASAPLPQAAQLSSLAATSAGVALDALAARLVGAPPSLDLPSTRLQPDRVAWSCRTVVRSLDPGTTVSEFARAHGLTEFQVLATAFAIAVGRIANQEDLVIGIPVLLRDTAELDRSIGCYVNLLPFRLAIERDEGFLRAGRRVAALLRSDLQSRHVPFHQALKASAVARAPDRHPLVQVIFTSRGGPAPELRLGGAVGRPCLLARRASPFDLSVDVLNEASELTVTAEYRDGLFAERDIERVLGAFHAVLSDGMRRPHEAVRRIRLMDHSEWEAVANVDEARFAGDAPPLTAVFQNLLSMPAERSAVACGGGHLSYGQLRRRVQEIAALLRSADIRVGDRVAVLLERRPDLPLALLAVLDLGAAYIPLDPALPGRRLAAILKDAAPKVVLTSAQAIQRIPELALPSRLDIDTAAAPGIGSRTLAGGADDGRHAAYVIYTSGSSGRPKGVEVSRDSLANLLAAISRALGFAAEDVMLSATTVSFDIAALELFLPLVAGGRLVLADDAQARDPWALAELMRIESPTYFQGTPSLLASLIESGAWTGSGGLTLLCGGEALPAALAPKLQARCRALYNMYGPTEATIWSTMRPVRSGEPVDVGAPLDGTRIYVLDRWNELRPFGTPGEVAIGGRGVATGYVGLDDLTRKRFVPDPVDAKRGRVFLTGDFGIRRSVDSLEILGREDDQVKLHGFRVELGEVEAVLASQADISRAAAFVVEKADGLGTQLCAAVVASRPLDLVDVRAQLQTVLPSYMIPHRLVQMADMPLTTSGKIDRNALALRCEAAPADDGGRAVRRSPSQETIARLFAKYLGNVPGDHDDFFALGGDSITAIRLLADIQAQFGTAIPVAKFLDGERSMAALALVLDRSDSGRGHADLTAMLDSLEAMSDEEAVRALDIELRRERGV